MSEREYKLSATDGWYKFSNDVYHYFFSGKSGCGIEMEENAHQDNDPKKYCGDCSRNIKPLLDGSL